MQSELERTVECNLMDVWKRTDNCNKKWLSVSCSTVFVLGIAITGSALPFLADFSDT